MERIRTGRRKGRGRAGEGRGEGGITGTGRRPTPSRDSLSCPGLRRPLPAEDVES